MSLRAVTSLKAATSLKADAPLRPLLTSLALGVVGGWLFQLTGMPLAWMLGPLVANLLGAMAGLRLGVPDRLRNLFLGVLGLTLGARVSPELVSHLSSWWLSALLLLAGVWASTLACAAWYRRCGFDATSAWFSSVPGALTAMVVIGERIGGDPQRIAVAQSLRVLLVIMILPPLYWVLEGAAGTPGIGSDVAVSGLWLIAVLPFLLLYASFIGACAGSTGGGMKVIRVLLLYKQGTRETKKLIHPHGVFPVKLGNKPVPDRVVEAVWGFCAVYVFAFAVLFLILLSTGLDFVTAFSALAACMNNLGPGLGEVATHYGELSATVKWILSFAMLLGRLEVFTLLVLFTPMFWAR